MPVVCQQLSKAGLLRRKTGKSCSQPKPLSIHRHHHHLHLHHHRNFFTFRFIVICNQKCTIVLGRGGWSGINWWEAISPRIRWVNGNGGGDRDKLDFSLAIDYWLAIECTVSMEILKFTSGNTKLDEIKIFNVRQYFKVSCRGYANRFSQKSSFSDPPGGGQNLTIVRSVHL